jgi:CDP-diacylglycerol--serine O-phosphatidyltransferase
MRTNLDALGLTYFVCCGLARLARFNATVALLPKDSTGKISHFEGLPIPSSLSIVALLAYTVAGRDISSVESLPLGIFQLPVPLGLHPALGRLHGFVLLFILHGTAMVSRTLRIPKP